MTIQLTRTTTTSPRVRVWDIGVRLFHWSLVASVAATYFVADQRALHRWLGYVVLALIGFRLIWGVIGGKHARFANFVPGPRAFARYMVATAKGREARFLGHNPAGGAMIVALLVTLACVGGSGYMMGMDAYFGVEWVEDTHKLLVNALLALIGLHVSGVILSSLRHRENLVLSMVTGLKEADTAYPQ